MKKIIICSLIITLFASTTMAASIQYKQEKKNIVPEDQVFAYVPGSEHEVKSKKRHKIVKKYITENEDNSTKIAVEKPKVEEVFYKELPPKVTTPIVIEETLTETHPMQIIKSSAQQTAQVIEDVATPSFIRNDYIQIDSGFVSVMDSDIAVNGTPFGDADFRGGGLISGKYGTYFDQNMHANIELGYRHNGLKAPSNLDVEPVNLMLNLVYDFNHFGNSRVTPYLQIGMGAVSDAAGSEFLSDVGFAYNFGAGIAYDISDRGGAELLLGYEYFGSLKDIETHQNGNKYDINYGSHNWKVGYKINF